MPLLTVLSGETPGHCDPQTGRQDADDSSFWLRHEKIFHINSPSVIWYHLSPNQNLFWHLDGTRMSSGLRSSKEAAFPPPDQQLCTRHDIHSHHNM